jgi:predicted dehydrogenase
MQTIRWGILGTGDIAGKFASALAVLPDAEIAAVGSRSQAGADAFGATWNIPRRHGSYEALMADGGVDIVYIATPHSLHRENCIGCLQAGKAVLCEKPFTINAREAEEVIRLARSKRLFLMEGMWTRFFPAVAKVRELLARQAVGEVRLLQADICFQSGPDPRRRLLDPALGGGALLDLGVYPVSFASMVFGSPARIASSVHFGPTGVDVQSSVILSYEGGRQAHAACSFLFDSPKEAVIIGTEGWIRVHRMWFLPEAVTWTPAGGEPQDFRFPQQGHGFIHEARAVMDCLRAGQLESAVMPLSESLEIMKTLDAVRKQWDFRYPMEQ